MRIDKGKISGTRFMFSIIVFLQASALLTSFLADVTRHESWLPALMGTIICIPLIFAYCTLMSMYPGKNFIQMLEIVFGKYLGKFMGLIYVWFFINIAGLNLLDLGAFAKITVMTKTPNLFLSISCMVVVVFAVRGGIKVVARYSSLFTFIEFFIVGISAILLLNQVRFGNLFPIFDLEPLKYVQATHIFTIIPFGELVALLMLNSNLNLKPKEMIKYWMWGVFWGILTILVVLIRDIAVLGNSFHFFTLPGLVSLRLVNVGAALSRTEILFAVALIMLLFFKITLHTYISTIAVCQLVGFKNFKHMALVVGLIIIFYSSTIYPNPIIHREAVRTIEPAIWTFFDMVIPLLTLLVGSIKMKAKKDVNIKRKTFGNEGVMTPSNAIWRFDKNFKSGKNFTYSKKQGAMIWHG